MVQFNAIPSNIRVPFMRFEFNAGANPYQSNSRLLIIGQKLAGGFATANEPIYVDDSDAQFGVNSMLSSMVKMARRQAPIQEIWALPLVDAGGSTAASGTITVANAPILVASSAVVYVGAVRVSIPISTTMTNANIATALAAAINAAPDIQVTAAAVSAVVTITANNKGTLGNTIRVETRLIADDGATADTLFTLVQPTGGAGDPTITAALTNTGDLQFDWIVMPYSTSSFLTEIETFLDDRWSPLKQIYGHAISAMTGSAGTILAATTAPTRNSWHSSVLGMNNSPQPTYLIAAALGGAAVVHLQDAPELSRPLQTVPLIGIRPPKRTADRWTVTQRQSFYYSGASAYDVGPAGEVRIERLITTYQKNAWGQPDQSWLDVNTIAQLMYGARSIMLGVTSIYPRAALMDENPNNVQGVATPRDVRDVIIHEYRKLENLAVFENTDLFASLLIVERNPNDPNRLDVYLPLDHVNALRVIAVNATSYQQFPVAA